jgi:hypothetical protein
MKFFLFFFLNGNTLISTASSQNQPFDASAQFCCALAILCGTALQSTGIAQQGYSDELQTSHHEHQILRQHEIQCPAACKKKRQNHDKYN